MPFHLECKGLPPPIGVGHWHFHHHAFGIIKMEGIRLLLVHRLPPFPLISHAWQTRTLRRCKRFSQIANFYRILDLTSFYGHYTISKKANLSKNNLTPSKSCLKMSMEL